MQHATVGSFMSPCPVLIDAQASLREAELLMGEHGIRHLPVMSQGRAIGVVSERDIAQVSALVPGGESRVTVVEAMTPVPYVVSPDMSLARVATRMATERYGCALVVEGPSEDVVGIFTTIDALRALAAVLPDE